MYPLFSFYPGPWSTRWGSVHKGIGRFILIHLLRRSLRHGARSIRLIQISAQLTALALYTSFGFESREPIHCWWGEMNSDCMTKELEAGKSRGWICRPLNFNDIIAADSMHQSCLGISRMNSLYNIIVDENNSRSKNEQSFYTSIGIFDSHGKLLAYNTGLIVLGWSIVKGEGEEKFNIFKYLLANAYQLHQSSSPPRPPPKLHTLARLYPSIDHWLQHDARIRIQRSENLMVLGEWQPVKHQQYIYCCSIVY